MLMITKPDRVADLTKFAKNRQSDSFNFSQILLLRANLDILICTSIVVVVVVVVVVLVVK